MFRKGDRVSIRPEWRDAGDDSIIWVVAEDEGGGRVLIEAQLGLSINPIQVVDTAMIENGPDELTVARAKREILADIASGRVPAAVRTFAELHDYVDANEYGGACEADGEFDFSDPAVVDFWNRVQDVLNDWLAAGRPG